MQGATADTVDDRVTAPAGHALAFGGFRLDPRNARLSDGERELELPPKAFAVLCHLAARPGLLVTKDELLDAVWGRRFVSESVLKTAVSTIRAVLGDDTRAPRFVETVSRRGYRFVATPVDDAAPSVATPAGATPNVPATPPVPAAPAAEPGPAELPVALEAPDQAVLIGRADALASLGGLLQAAVAGSRQMVLVAGEAGIGKTALLRQLAGSAQAAGAWVATGQCIEQAGGGEPYLPVLDALAELSRGAEGAPWLAALRQVAPTWLAQLPWLVPPAEQAALRQALAGALQDRMLREFGALLDAVTPARPLLLVIEDLHWSDHATVSLLGYLARRRSPARVMLVASYRPIDAALGEHAMQALRQELRLHRLCTELMLQPFSELDIDHYLRDRLGDQLPGRHEALARSLHAHTEGLPLFVANLVDDLARGGAFEPGAGAGTGDPAALLAQLQVPDTLSGVIERQIARLPGELRALLEAAAVLGLEFAHPALAALLGWEAELLRARCDGLVRRAEWLRSAGLATLPGGALAARFAFRHALHRRVFYERLSAAQRLQLHLQAAQALQALFGAQADRSAAEVAWHLEAASETAPLAGVALPAVEQEALAWRLRAAQAAVAVHAPEDALAHFARAWRSGPSAAERVRIGLERAALQQQLGRGAQALVDSATALAEARALGDTALLQQALRVRARLCQENDQPDQAIALVDELLAGEAAPRGAERARALMVQAQALVGAGRLPESARVAQAALDAVPADEAPAARADILAAQVLWHFHRATFAEGLAIAEQAMALYEQAGNALGAAYMAGRRGAFLLNMERADEAEAALRDARTRSVDLRDVQGQRTAVLNLVKVLTDRGDATSALALLDEGWQAAPDFESPVAECAFLHGFYYCHYLRGELGAALADAARVRRSAEGLNSVYWRIGSAVLVVSIHTHLGDLATAGEMVEQALALSHAREVHHLWPRVVGHRAWLAVLAGEPERALAQLDEVAASGDPVPAEDLAAMQRVRAQAQLALGRPGDALATLANFDGAPTQEVWALMLALRLQAQLQLHGAAAPADLARAAADLSDDRLPALERLLLRQALVGALRAAGREAEAGQQARLASEHRARLAASLQGWPRHQAAFLHSVADLAA